MKVEVTRNQAELLNAKDTGVSVTFMPQIDTLTTEELEQWIKGMKK